MSTELRAAGLTSAEVEASLGALEGMTTGAGETLGGLLAIYDDPMVIVEAIQAIPEAVENFDEIIEQLPAAIDAQQEQNNPHEEGDRYYDDFRYGWYQGYFSWFVVEMAIPVGEANRALQSTQTAQRTFDAVEGTQIQRAGQLIRQTLSRQYRVSWFVWDGTHHFVHHQRRSVTIVVAIPVPNVVRD